VTGADLTFRAACADDWPAISRLLREAGLPLDGARECLPEFLVAWGAAGIAGCAALEGGGEAALLRSVAVADSARGTGLGTELVRRSLERAREAGIGTVYLLTTTATGFFPRFGFVPAERAEVPSAVRESPEFRGACPEDAVLLRVDVITEGRNG